MVKIPIKLDLAHRPVEPARSPYGECCNCYYIYEGVSPEQKCPACGSLKQVHNPWPRQELVELWKEQVDIWNRGRVELAVIVAAMYFESSIFHLLYLGRAWLDPRLNWLDASVEETQKKVDEIWRSLNRIRSPRATNKALLELFGHSGEEMLRDADVLGSENADYYLDQYRRLREHRNCIVHQGRRYTVMEEDGTVSTYEDPQAEVLLNSCLEWIPACWAVFAKLHNKYIHPHMWARTKGARRRG